MAHQFPLQLVNQGQQGKQLYDSIMENASSKAVFRLHSEENLRPLAQWLFRGVMNQDEIKLSMESTKVMGYEEVERTSRTTGTAKTSSVTRTEGSSESTSKGRSRSAEAGEGLGIPSDIDDIDFLMRERGDETGTESASYSVTDSHQESAALSEGETESYSETVSSVLMPIMGKELAHVQFRSLEEQLERAMGTLFGQGQRQGVVRLVGMKAPVSIHTPTVTETVLSPERVKAYVAKLMEKWKFALPAGQASLELAERERLLELQLRQSAEAGEPETSRRRVSP
jgi:hypothetical protein